MDDMEVDEMDLDDNDVEIDQGRRQRAAKKYQKRFAPSPNKADASSMSNSQAREILRHVTELSCGNKISVSNAFDLEGIEALKTLVFSDHARDSALCGEGHFQYAGIGLEASTKIYCKRVDAVYNLANSMGATANGARQTEDTEGDGQQPDGMAGDDGGGRGGKAKKRQGTVNADATLVEDSALRQRVKEPTFDMDPFFVRTSRLIDENSPQGLLLHNLPVLSGNDIVFDSSIRPQALLAQARERASAAEPANDITIDLTVLPGARESLAAMASASMSISPGIEQLYAALQSRPELPGLQIASKVDPDKLLRDALAANEGALAADHRRAVERQALRQAEDAMDVDVDDGGAGGDPHNAGGQGKYGTGPDGGYDDGAGPWLDDEDGGCGGTGGDPDGMDGTAFDVYDSPGYGAGCGGDDGDDDVDEAPSGGRRGGDGDGGDDFSQQPAGAHYGGEAGAEQDASDDESALFSMLSGAANGSACSSLAMQRAWWKRRARKTTAAGSKPRARKLKPEHEPLDWRSTPEPLLEAVQLHTYKTARRDASAKLCMPLEEPPRPEALHAYFSAAPAVADMSFPVGGRSCSALPVGGFAAGRGGSFACSVQETWRALLIADHQCERALRRGARAAAARKSLGNTAAATTATATPGAVPGGPRVGEPSASGTHCPFGAADGGEEYDAPGLFGDDGGFADDGPSGAGADAGGGYGDDESDDDSGEGGGAASFSNPFATPTQDDRGPSLEELLQPPRRVRRLAVKYDKTAGVADVATLKANIEVSLKELAASAASERRKSAPLAVPQLSFQSVLDQVSAHAMGQAGEGPGHSSNGHGLATRGAGGGGSHGGCFLTGVSTHLAFICLLHLANEKGLALGSSEQLDALVITGLGDLVAAQ